MKALLEIEDVTFAVRAGEILGVGGVAGNGPDELLAALSGEARTAPGAVRPSGDDIGHLGPNARRALEVLVAPEKRRPAARDAGLRFDGISPLRGQAKSGR